MGLNVKIDSFQYTGGSTSNIVRSGYGFQPKVLIIHWNGRSSATDAVGAQTMRQGWGFAGSTADQRSVSHISTTGGASAAGGTYHRTDAIVCQGDDTGALDGYFSLATLGSDGFTMTVPDAISVDLTFMVIALGGTDITNAKAGTETDNSTTGNKSTTGPGFQPDIVFFVANIDQNNASPGGSNSEAGIAFGVAKASGAGNQYVAAHGSDDGSANMDTGAYIFDNEFLASTGTSTPTSTVARKQFVSMDTNGFTWNQLELPTTAGSQFNWLAIKGARWAVGDLLTLTGAGNITESGFGWQPSLLIFLSTHRAKSTQDTGTAHSSISFGAATSPTNRMAMATWDENATANAEVATAIEYDAVYANISSADAIQGLMDIVSFDSDGFTATMDDTDPAQSFVWYVAVAPASTGYTLVADQGSFSLSGQATTLKADRLLTAGQGSFALTGQAANTLKGFKTTADFGSFALSGQAANLLIGRGIIADPGLFSLSGQSALLEFGRIMHLDVGSYALTGQDAILRRGYGIIASAGSFSLTGQAANLLANRILIAAAGSYALSGQAANINKGYTLALSAGLFSLSGQGANLLAGRRLAADGGSYALSGQIANLLLGRLLTAALGSYALSGQVTQLLKGSRLVAVQGSYSLTGIDANLVYWQPGGYTLTAGVGNFAATGQPANLLVGRQLQAQHGSFGLSGIAAALLVNRRLATSHGVYVLTGLAVNLVAPSQLVIHVTASIISPHQASGLTSSAGSVGGSEKSASAAGSEE